MKKFLFLWLLLPMESLDAMFLSQMTTLSQMSEQERLHFAIRHEEIEVIKKILEKATYRENPEKINELYKGQTHLYKAIESGDIQVVKLLIRYGADVNRTNSNGESPLQAAVHGGNASIVELLLCNGADQAICNKNYKKPVY